MIQSSFMTSENTDHNLMLLLYCLLIHFVATMTSCMVMIWNKMMVTYWQKFHNSGWDIPLITSWSVKVFRFCLWKPLSDLEHCQSLEFLYISPSSLDSVMPLATELEDGGKRPERKKSLWFRKYPINWQSHGWPYI